VSRDLHAAGAPDAAGDPARIYVKTAEDADDGVPLVVLEAYSWLRTPEQIAAAVAFVASQLPAAARAAGILPADDLARVVEVIAGAIEREFPECYEPSMAEASALALADAGLLRVPGDGAAVRRLLDEAAGAGGR
jgi:hypothetical protein